MKHVALASLALLLAACATAPVGPRVAVMPAPGKPFEVFVEEDRICRQWADQSLGVDATDAANRAWVGTTAVGTAVGAVAGAAVGGRDSAGAGAAMGTVMGAAAGSDRSAATSYDLQRRYDIAYQQCMYAKGNQIPGYRTQPAAGTAAPPPPPPPPR
ncbi:hypothetical protein B9N43_05810 [Denitratisoma sp. DHT3]|nr:hypothetical protein B9N43_05810 [Denitratisoma sp. DHT3]